MYQQLLDGRSTNGKPHFWNPNPIEAVPHTLIFDEDMDCQSEWNVDQAIQRTIALGLHLEIPVGTWVSEGRKLESQLPKVALKLLQINVSDEARHDAGLRYAAKAYPIDKAIMNEAEMIANTWLDSPEHPLSKAMFAEVGVFLAGGLAILRLAGGTSLSDMAEQIARDEAIHVSTNSRVLRDLGMNPQNPNVDMRNIVNSTLDWLVGNLNIPGRFLGESFDFNKQFVVESSKELIETGVAKRINELLNISVTASPMEMSNSKLYSRVFE